MIPTPPPYYHPVTCSECGAPGLLSYRPAGPWQCEACAYALFDPLRWGDAPDPELPVKDERGRDVPPGA